MGRKLSGNNAGLRNNNGKVMTPPIAKTVSELLVFMPNVKKSLDHASPKKASVKKISKISDNTSGDVKAICGNAIKYPNPRIMAVWITTLNASLLICQAELRGDHRRHEHFLQKSGVNVSNNRVS